MTKIMRILKVQENYKRFPTIAVLTLLALCTQFAYVTAWTASVNDSRRLVHDFIDEYDRRMRPVANQTKPIDVYFTFFLLNLLEIDEVQQRIHINAWVNFSWWDEVRTWNPQDYNGIDVIHPDPLDTWRPRTIVANSIGPRDIFGDDYAPASILSSGSTTWSPGAIFYLSCQLDLTYFPFDTQTCQARILANDLATEINLIPTRPFVLAGGYTEHGEWVLVSSSITKSILVFGGRPYYVRVIVSLTYERRPTYHLLNVLSPVMVLSFLSLLGFVVPKESGERVSFAITVLLSLAVFMGVISGQLPPSSDTFPVISIYIFSLLCLSGFSVLIIVCQLRVASFFPENNNDDDNINNINENPEPDVDERQTGRGSGRGNRYIIKCKEINKGDNRDIRTDFESESGTNSNSFDNDSSSTHLNGRVLDTGRTGSTTRNIPNGLNLKKENGDASANNNTTNVSSKFDDDHDGFYGQKVESDTVAVSSASFYSRRQHREMTTLKFKSVCRKLLFKYDDLILFLVFTIAWAIFTIIFFHKVLEKN